MMSGEGEGFDDSDDAEDNDDVDDEEDANGIFNFGSGSAGFKGGCDGNGYCNPFITDDEMLFVVGDLLQRFGSGLMDAMIE